MTNVIHSAFKAKNAVTYKVLEKKLNRVGFNRVLVDTNGDKLTGVNSVRGAAYKSVDRNYSGHRLMVVVNHTRGGMNVLVTGFDEYEDTLVDIGFKGVFDGIKSTDEVAGIASTALAAFHSKKTETKGGDALQVKLWERELISKSRIIPPPAARPLNAEKFVSTAENPPK